MHRAISIALVTLIVIASSVLTGAYAQNVLTNGDFERWLGNIPEGWEPPEYPGITLTPEATMALDGSAAKLTWTLQDGGLSSERMFSQIVPILDNSTYQFSAYADFTRDNAPLYGAVAYVNPNGGYVDWWDAYALVWDSTTQGYQQKEKTIPNARNVTGHARVVLRVGVQGTTNSTAYIDNVSLDDGQGHHILPVPELSSLLLGSSVLLGAFALSRRKT
jgi:hypothetical protein